MLSTFFKKRLLPAVTLPDAECALHLAEAYLEADLNVMEVTFRTPAAATAISVIAKEYPEIHIGAGTILSVKNLKAAANAGAEFGLAPGFNPSITDKAIELDFPFIPGVMTPSEIERAFTAGFKVLKVFPIKSVGGANYLKALEGPYAHTDLQFIPMGGVTHQNMNAYLNHQSVLAVGGSWLSPSNLIQNREFKSITKVVRESISAMNVD
ncbi:bifunctional 4-hydroxy-2-oxoglutarate aldolase/2-dehydro-3-deoxy-phosphogluconate aldolase [Fodinibius salsisoli]|uniref:Bifunctional 4-hydroxy-2-oxoglutarate aldolase/2-dehydro-3-deoxy-phosphogluconate aldolase n=1 Tax=Fodinibius salsisoli TaxID=2820877 RepID=A0ABT3PQI8_9BACT|nr:bifunctional 4-hydroxy-2-oxoglutarate aldolase/2-dehydro-3-deoxy-phosphogluconate aldolase [Fodinibius salsisoli]MCW9708132.1 bifunctional 4-hydroxy-2-oxoglutarate aldolase/2-dehydro-3-deoxy-phosphogluconate aldolase [Fodinibius salsisoli]